MTRQALIDAFMADGKTQDEAIILAHLLWCEDDGALSLFNFPFQGIGKPPQSRFAPACNFGERVAQVFGMLWGKK